MISIPEHIRPYKQLIEEFLEHRVSVEEFETRYLQAFKQDSSVRPGALYEILHELFVDVDAFQPDPLRKTRFEIDESELRNRAHKALIALHHYIENAKST